MSLKPPGSGRAPDSTSNSALAKPTNSFLGGGVGQGSMRSGVGGSQQAGVKSNFSKMVSGRAGQSTRGGNKGGDKSSGSGRRSRKKKKDDSARVLVDGKDVTPLPLMSAHIGSMGFHAASTAAGATTIGGGASTADLTGLDASQTEHGGLMGPGMFPGGMLAHGGVSTVSADSEHVFLGAGFQGGDEKDWSGGFALMRSGMNFEYQQEQQQQQPVKIKEWTDKELREKHTIKIEETETLTLFHLPSIKIWTEDETDALKQEKANKNYQQCLEKHKEKDKYLVRAVQTFNPTSREKEVQVAPPITRSQGVEVSTWDIFDVQAKLDQVVQAHGPGGGNVPRIQHESDLLHRAAAVGLSTSVGSAASRQEEEEEDLLNSRAEQQGRAGGGAQGGQGGATGTSNTPSVQSAQQSFHGGASSGASFRGGAGGKERSWHQNINLTSSSGTGNQSGQSSSNLAGHGTVGGASQSQYDASGKGGAGQASTTGGPGSGGGAGGNQGPKIPSALDKLLAKPPVLKKLRALEQAVLQNTLHSAQMLYRHHPEAREQDWLEQRSTEGPKYEFAAKEGGNATGTSGGEGSSMLPPLGGNSSASAHTDRPGTMEGANGALANQQSPAGVSASLIPLWSFQCPLTKGMNVSCLSWNKQNLDLLAAGYGSVEFGHSSRDRYGNPINGIVVPSLPKDGVPLSGSSPVGGLILFWSLKNPAYPQKVFYTKSAVTSLDFSEEHPHLLAAGMYDGSVAVYDIRDTSSKPALESLHSSGKHSEPVWGVKFVAKELHKRSQQLTSISTDGSVKQWSMKKGLVPHELMQLKRMTNRAQLQGTTMEGVSREASGMCFDFPINDGTQYFAGTEDGLIHKCSVSYNEQTLENFYGHTGPVYKVRCSPFLPDAFLSCSADWSAMLWSQKVSSKPVLKFNASAGHDYIVDIVWSQNQACMFGLVSREGRLEIWDLDVSPLDPVIKYQIPVEEEITPAAAAVELTSSTTTTGAVTGGPTLTSSLLNQPPPTKKRTLSCMSFSSNAPVVLVGTSDGSIELFRLEGTALTTRAPHTPGQGADPSVFDPSTYGQELNASTVMQVPRDRERDHHLPGIASEGSAFRAALHEEQSRVALEQHQAQLVKFKEQARKLESIMEQHNDTKNKLAAAESAPNGAPAVGAPATGAAK